MCVWLGEQEEEISENRLFELNYARFLRFFKEEGHSRQRNSVNQSKVGRHEKKHSRVSTVLGTWFRRWGERPTRFCLTCEADLLLSAMGPAQMFKQKGDIFR